MAQRGQMSLPRPHSWWGRGKSRSPAPLRSSAQSTTTTSPPQVKFTLAKRVEQDKKWIPSKMKCTQEKKTRDSKLRWARWSPAHSPPCRRNNGCSVSGQQVPRTETACHAKSSLVLGLVLLKTAGLHCLKQDKRVQQENNTGPCEPPVGETGTRAHPTVGGKRSTKRPDTESEPPPSKTTQILGKRYYWFQKLRNRVGIIL